MMMNDNCFNPFWDCCFYPLFHADGSAEIVCCIERSDILQELSCQEKYELRNVGIFDTAKMPLFDGRCVHLFTNEEKKEGKPVNRLMTRFYGHDGESLTGDVIVGLKSYYCENIKGFETREEAERVREWIEDEYGF